MTSQDVVRPGSPGDRLAELAGVTKRFGKTRALYGLDLEVRRGELLAVLGPNGAGKTTAISLMLGLSAPDSGSARLLGESPRSLTARRHVGAMLQEASLTPELRVRELVELFGSYYPAPYTTDETLARTRTAVLADRPYGKLSGGQKRQAQLAVAVCGRPSLLFLDEPTVGLDTSARETVWEVLRELVAGGSSIVLTTHYLEEAEALADRVVVLAQGRAIAAGTVSEVRAGVARTHLTCSSQLPEGEVSRWPGVLEATRAGERLRVVAADADRVLRRLLLEDPGARDLEVRHAGLAEAVTELTREVVS